MVRLRQPVAVVLSSLLVTTPVHAQTAPVAVAPGTGNTRVATAPNGTTIVDIATPNAAGLSQNRYTNFNVPASGVVLNNTDPSKFTWASQLAGSVTVNFNIDKPATVILNEVVAPNPTTIAGTTEVAGTRADVVIANPYGIAVNGGTFLNTDQVTLTTGTPLLGATGALSGLRVGTGQIVISGAGLDASNLDYLNLVARSLRFDGQVNARTLTAAAGAADYNYASRTATANSSASGTTPTYAIDSTALGGMYADRIRFVATDAGIGVRMASDVAATGDDFTVTSAGRIQITAGHQYAARDLALTSSSGVEISGANTALTAKQDLALTANGSDVKLTDATLVAGRNFSLTGATLADSATSQPTQATRFALADFTLNFSGASTVDRSAYGAGGNFALRTGSLAVSNAAAFYSGADSTRSDRALTLRATTGDLDLGNAQVTSPATLALTADAGAVRTATGSNIQSTGSLAIASASPFVNAGSIQSGGDLTVRSATASNVSIVNRGNLIAAGDLLLPGRTSTGAVATAASIDNSGSIGGRTVDVRADTLTNSGIIQGTQGLTATAGLLDNRTDGVILTAGEAGRNVAITAGDLRNGGYIQSTGTLTVAITRDLSNSGVLATAASTAGGANGLTTLTSRAVTNTGSIQSAGDLAVTASAGIDNSGALQAAGLMTLSVGPMLNNYAAGSAIATGNLTVTSPLSAFSLFNAGRLQTAANLTLGNASSPVALTQSGTGVSLATGTLQTTASTVDNAGTLQSGGALTLTATGAVVNSADATILTTGAAAPISVTAASLTNAGSIQSAGTLTSTTTGAFNNSGTITTTGNLTGDASTFTNSGLVSSGASLALTAANTSGTTLTNSGTLQAVGSLAFVTPGALSNTTAGRILAGTSATLTGGNAAFSVNNAGLVQAGTTLSVGNASNRVALVNGGTLLAVGALDATVSTASNQGTLQAGGALTVAATGAVTNASGAKILTAGATPTDVTLTAAALDNAGTIQSTGAIASTTTGATTNSGTIATLPTSGGGANGALTTTSLTLNNTGTVQSAGTLALTATSTTGTALTNSGTLQSAAALTLTTPSLSNAVTGKIDGGAALTVANGTAAFSLGNGGLIQSAQDMTLGTASSRGALTNDATATILAGGALAAKLSSLTNSGLVQSGGALAADATGDIANHSGAKLLTANAGSALALTAANLTNVGIVQSAGALNATLANALTNSGTFATLATADGGAAGALTTTSLTLNNSGTVQSAGTLALTATSTAGTALTNSGTLRSAAALTLTTPSLTNTAAGQIGSGANLAVANGSTAFTLANRGLIQSAQDATLGTATSRGALTNEADASLLAGGALTAKLSSLTNNGLVQSGGALAVDATGDIANNSAAKLLTANAGSALTLAAANLTNAGTIQSAGALGATLTTAFTNSGSIATVAAANGGADGALTASAGGAWSNSGTVSSAGALTLSAGTTFTNVAGATIKSTGNALLTTGSGAFTNGVGARIASDGDLSVRGTAAFNLTNSGLLQSGGALSFGDSAHFAALTNAAGATLQSGAAMTGYASGFSNSGTIQSGDSTSFTLASGVTVRNAAGAKLLAGDALTLTAASGAFTLDNFGTVQASGLMTLGGASHLVTLTNESGAKLFAGSFAVTAGAIDNYGTIMGTGGGTISATSFSNHGATSKFLGATDAGATTLNVSGAVTNEGAMFSMDDFTVRGATLNNTDTGGLSSLGNLTVSTTGNLTNDGALYSGAKLTLTSTSGGLTNSYTGTIDTDGDFAATATGGSGFFANQGQINIGGSGTITTTTFTNVMPGAENLSRTWLGLNTNGSTINEHDYTTASQNVPNVSTNQWYFGGHGGYSGSWFDDRSSPVWGDFYEKQVFSGIANPSTTFGDLVKPQIAATNLTLNGFNSAKNVGGLLTATGSLTISGNGGSGGSSTFLNDAMALDIQKWHYDATWWYEYTLGSYDWWNPTGSNHITDVHTSLTSENSYFSIGAGIRAGQLNLSVGSLNNVNSAYPNLGSASAAQTTSTTASASTTTALVSATTVDGAGVASGTGGLVTLSAQSATGSGSRATLATAQAAGGATAAGLSNAGTLAGATRVGAFASALKNATVSLGGVTLKLPSNPNGYFVANADPQAKFLVSVNAGLGIDASSAVGSDFLAKQLGLNPDQIQKRVGDPAYETYLVRQQLVEQLGTRLLAGAKSEADQMQTLMANGATEAKQLGLQLGQAPTPAQLAHLDRDIVWMVDQVVGGEHVLVPQVYLSAKTRSLFSSTDAVIAGDDVSVQAGSLTNTGGTLSGGKTLALDVQGDIKNTSGTIGGGDVSLKAGGSIINETTTAGNSESTIVGKTGRIAATGNLDLTAGKDIKILGADVKAGGDASLAAGDQIVVDTVQTKTTTRTTTASSGVIGSSSTTTTTTDVKNQAANLDFGGSLKIKSGNDTTLAGANVNVGGNLATDVGGSLNVLARQDQHTVETKSSESGIGVNGGLYGEHEKTTTDFTGRNFGTTLNVGGDATLKAKNDLTLEGSDVAIKGNADLNATNVNILDGKDEHKVTTTEKSMTIGAFSDSSSDAGASANARAGNQSASASTKDGSSTDRSGRTILSADANAQAGASGSGELTVGVRTTETNSMDYESKSRASTLKIGGNATINATNTLTVRGSDLETGGDLTLNAKDQKFLAGQDLKISTSDSKTMTAGLSFTGEGSAEASANASANGTNLDGKAGAEAKGEVGAGIKYQNDTTSTTTVSSTARVSTIKTGGNLTRNAGNNITDVGTSIDVGGDLTQKAKTIDSLAAKDTSYTTTDSSSMKVTLGVYAEAHAGANANAGTGAMSASDAGAEASAGASVGGKIGFNMNNSTTTSSTRNAVVSNIKVKGNVTSTSTDKTTFEGTNITTGGDVNLSAKAIDFKAAQNTTSDTSKSQNIDVGLKGGVGAGASASTSDGADAGYGPQGSLSVGYGNDKSSSSTSTAVTGSINSGGKLNIKTADDMRFEGTKLSSGGQATLDAGGNVTFDAARNTSTSTSDSIKAGLDLSASKSGDKKSVGLGLSGGYGTSTETTSDAVTGSITSGSGLTIKSGGSATFEGTNLAAKGDTSISAKQDVTFNQATSTSTKNGFDVSADLGVGGSSEKGKSQSRSGSLGLSGDYTNETTQTAQTSNITSGGKLTISSGGDTTLQGVNVDAKSDVNVNAGGNLNLKAKEESSHSVNLSASLSLGGEKSQEAGKEDSSKSKFGAALGVEGGSSQTQTGATIKSGGNVNLTSGQNTTLVGAQVDAKGDVNVTAGGSVTQTKTSSAQIGGQVGLSGKVEGETKGTTTTKAAGAVTDVGFSAQQSSQSTTLKAGSGKVTVKQNTPPAKKPVEQSSPTAAPAPSDPKK